MTLLTAHRILIGAAVVFFVFYALWEWLGHGTGPGSVWRGGLSILAALALAVYFGTLFRRAAVRAGGREGS